MSTDEGAEDPVDFGHGQLTYLQLPATDPAASARFYEQVLGWATEGASFEATGVFGQWTDERAAVAESGPVLWFHIDDLDSALERVRAGGGVVHDGPTPDGPSRMLATVGDPAGNTIGLMQHRAAA